MNRKLKDIAHVFSGIYRQELPVGDTLYLQVKDFATASSLNVRHPSLLKQEGLQKHLLEDKDVLFAAKGTSNFCVVYHPDMGPAVASTSFLILRTFTDEVLPEYLCWFINLPQTLKSLQTQAVGSSIPLITKDMLVNITVAVPPRDIQNKVIALSRMQQLSTQLKHQIADKQDQLYNLLLINAIK